MCIYNNYNIPRNKMIVTPQGSRLMGVGSVWARKCPRQGVGGWLAMLGRAGRGGRVEKKWAPGLQGKEKLVGQGVELGRGQEEVATIKGKGIFRGK